MISVKNTLEAIVNKFKAFRIFVRNKLGGVK